MSDLGPSELDSDSRGGEQESLPLFGKSMSFFSAGFGSTGGGSI